MLDSTLQCLEYRKKHNFYCGAARIVLYFDGVNGSDVTAEEIKNAILLWGKAMSFEIKEELLDEELSCFEPTRRTSTASLEDFLDARVPMPICKSFVRSLLQSIHNRSSS